MSAYEMVSFNRSAITIEHQDGNYYVISAHRPGDEEPSEIYLTVPQMPELARMLVNYVTAMIPLHGLGPDDRFEFEKVLAALRDYLRADLPYEAMAGHGHGVIAALPSRGKIEWRVIDLDAGSSEPIGGRIYRTSPAVAGQWLLTNMVSAQELLSINDVIQIRDAAVKIVNGKLNGERETNKLTALIKNAFVEYLEREGENFRTFTLKAMQPTDLDRINLFISRHQPLRLDAAVMFRVGNQLDSLRQSTISIAIKLAYGVAGAITAAEFGRTIAQIDGDGNLSHGSINQAEFSKSTAALFSKAFEELEDKLKLMLTATTKTKVKLVSRIDTVSDWLINRVVEHVAAQFSKSGHITISKEQENTIAAIADSWWWDTVANALEANDLVAVMLTGIHAGSVVNLADCSEFGLLYPVRRVTNL